MIQVDPDVDGFTSAALLINYLNKHLNDLCMNSLNIPKIYKYCTVKQKENSHVIRLLDYTATILEVKQQYKPTATNLIQIYG